MGSSPWFLSLIQQVLSVLRQSCSAPWARSAPREGAVGRGMKFPLGKAGKAERLEQVARRPADVVGHQMADADHLVAVIGIGHHIDVVAEAVEDREAVGREAADAAGRLLLVKRQLALESLLAERERRAPHMS